MTAQTLVLRFNTFSYRLVDAYWLSDPKTLLTAKEAFTYLADNPETKCKVLEF